MKGIMRERRERVFKEHIWVFKGPIEKAKGRTG